ncbi:hypothetical protein CEXT_374411 [Caerostris extrusa]|uniref:Uncharacterized protein n=1 Tax=Caerostris extrusa TaxID=172846 RepID=A0AAV4XA87_CAEEX|nr:hypothetical protein CEXT_374411 [Caerostris extrusa]
MGDVRSGIGDQNTINASASCVLSQASWSINEPTFCWVTNYIPLPAGQCMETVHSAPLSRNAHSNITVPLGSQIVEPVLWNLWNI